MKRIFLSIGSILFAGAILAGGTGAMLHSGNSSTGNTFATGVIRLLVDNESYATDNWGDLYFSTTTSWAASNLDGKFFFKFNDLKPGDIGEDTISLHVDNNNAWACMNVNLTGTPEYGQNEPEQKVDPTSGPNDGELQDNLYFVFWADDGDNVYEKGENVFKEGLVKNLFNGKQWAIADSATNIWWMNTPLIGGTTYYIGKAWCFGEMNKTPLPQDDLSKTGANGPLFRGTGFTCSGANVGNIVQSDGIKADVSFAVAQSRNNKTYRCDKDDNTPPPPRRSTLFSEDFNDCSKDAKDEDDRKKGKIQTPKTHDSYNWSKRWSCGGDNGYNDHGGKCTQNLDLDSGNQSHTESLTTPAINTTGYRDITLSYTRKTDDTNAPPKPVGVQTLVVEYSVNNGASWTTLETVTGETPSTLKTFSLSPSADNKPNVLVRFRFSGADNTNHAYIDDVVVTGVNP